jgi:circadian clock protein KaiB
MPEHPSEDDSSTYLLKLFVNGSSPRAAIAVANLNRICNEQLDGRYHIQVIDVEKEPHLAEEERVLATPTLIKKLPPPLRRIIGDLSDQEKVLVGLEVRRDGPSTSFPPTNPSKSP